MANRSVANPRPRSTRGRGKKKPAPVLEWTILVLIVFYGLFWTPWLVVAIWARGKITSEPGHVPLSSAALVFGGLYDIDGPISEINRERLLGARELLWTNRVGSIVVSNTEAAARGMRDYLVEQQVSEAQIEVDTLAVKTPDTCRDELFTHPEKRRVVFVSHAYHLPRILYQCHKLGLEGTGFAADNIASAHRAAISPAQTFIIRVTRMHREAFFILATLLGFY